MRTTGNWMGGVALRALTLLVALVSLRCGSTTPRVTVTLSNPATDTSAIEIDATLDGHLLQGPPARIDENPDSFVANLPADATGLLRLTVSAIGSAGCMVAQGSADLQLDGSDSYEVTLTLANGDDQQGCRIEIVRSGLGSGIVTDADGRQLCDFATSAEVTTCVVSYPRGEQIELAAHAISDSYFAGWTGECTGLANCALAVNAYRRTVRVGLQPLVLCRGTMCWEHPQPQGNNLNALHGVSSDDVWMVGDAATLLHWNGVYAEDYALNRGEGLHAVRMVDHSTGWAVGDAGLILQWNGATWSSVTSPTTQSLNGVWSADANAIWAVGAAGTIL